ncbi:hypothetical protein [Candidatus Frankia alpina]|uniref:Uncharacterized protein n=1 Tax=Candidatus Frankia alpina TaxID=2699483 RepID=A0A4S5BIP0_9ACTN|nr:hypothetical protein [Candidatus Frankia alpina]THJ29508.1 hypothetical protein E7Y31_22860 [Candidatus Frankia alpina]
MDTRHTSFPLIFGISPVSGMSPVSSSAPPPRAFPAEPASAPAWVEDHDPADAADPAATPAWEEQLDALARCLSRMDALMAMLEADLERHTRILAALADPLPQLAPVALAPLPPYPDLPAGTGGSGPGGQR